MEAAEKKEGEGQAGQGRRQRGQSRAMVQGAFPGRLGAMYVIGAPMLFRAALCMAKHLLGPKSKLIERIVLLDSANDLHQFVKSDTLDSALGDRSREGL